MANNFNENIEHSIGNGEVDGSIPSGSTIFQNSPTALAAFFCVNDLAFPAACGSTVEAAN
jgi:hypothetical protein